MVMAQQRGAPAGDQVWRQRRDEARARAPVRPALRLDSPVAELPRVRAPEVKLLGRLGLHTIRDLLLHLPFGWESYGDPTPVANLTPGLDGTVVGTLLRVRRKHSAIKGKLLTEAVLAD